MLDNTCEMSESYKIHLKTYKVLLCLKVRKKMKIGIVVQQKQKVLWEIKFTIGFYLNNYA